MIVMVIAVSSFAALWYAGLRGYRYLRTPKTPPTEGEAQMEKPSPT